MNTHIYLVFMWRRRKRFFSIFAHKIQILFNSHKNTKIPSWICVYIKYQVIHFYIVFKKKFWLHFGTYLRFGEKMIKMSHFLLVFWRGKWVHSRRSQQHIYIFCVISHDKVIMWFYRGWQLRTWFFSSAEIIFWWHFRSMRGQSLWQCWNMFFI